MGWLYQQKPSDVKQYLFDNLTWTSPKQVNRCLAISMKLNVAYAAVQTTDRASGESGIWCAILKMQYVRGETEFNWGYKDMDETVNPSERDCPARILDLLTPTDDEAAMRWRESCRKRLGRSIPPFGSMVRFNRPIRFSDGSEESEFRVVRYGKRKKRVRGASGGLYRLPRRIWHGYDWCIVDKLED